MFWRESLRAGFNESKGELSRYVEKVVMIELTGTLVLLLFKAACVKVRQINIQLVETRGKTNKRRGKVNNIRRKNSVKIVERKPTKMKMPFSMFLIKLVCSV